MIQIQHRHPSLAEVNRELDAAFASTSKEIIDWGPFAPAPPRPAKRPPPFRSRADQRRA